MHERRTPDVIYSKRFVFTCKASSYTFVITWHKIVDPRYLCKMMATGTRDTSAGAAWSKTEAPSGRVSISNLAKNVND